MQFFKLLWTFFVMAKNKTHEQFLEELREKNEHFREGRFIVVGGMLIPLLNYLLRISMGKGNKEHSYLPIKDFRGKYECFSKINEETINFKLNENIEDVKKTIRIN